MALGDPGNRLNVAQSAGTGLYVGLEVVGRVVGLGVSVGLFADFGFEEFLDRPNVLGRERGPHAINER